MTEEVKSETKKPVDPKKMTDDEYRVYLEEQFASVIAFLRPRSKDGNPTEFANDFINKALQKAVKQTAKSDRQKAIKDVKYQIKKYKISLSELKSVLGTKEVTSVVRKEGMEEVNDSSTEKASA